MLTLSRRVGESIMIGDEITLTVMSVTGSRVRLAFRRINRIRPVIRRNSKPDQRHSVIGLGTTSTSGTGSLRCTEPMAAPNNVSSSRGLRSFDFRQGIKCIKRATAQFKHVTVHVVKSKGVRLELPHRRNVGIAVVMTQRPWQPWCHG